MTTKLPVQRLQAELAAAGANRDSRTVPVTFYTGAQVLRFNWERGIHKLTLSMESGDVRLGKLKSGRAPFTLGHADSNDPLATIGVILNPSIQNGKAKADIRFSKRPDVEPIFTDVLDGILVNVSVGAQLHKLKETTAKGDEVKSFLATDWEPYAVALVGIGADPGAHFAAGQVDCQIDLCSSGWSGVSAGQLGLQQRRLEVAMLRAGATSSEIDALALRRREVEVAVAKCRG